LGIGDESVDLAGGSVKPNGRNHPGALRIKSRVHGGYSWLGGSRNGGKNLGQIDISLVVIGPLDNFPKIG
jgi:hypothetical protein